MNPDDGAKPAGETAGPAGFPCAAEPRLKAVVVGPDSNRANIRVPPGLTVVGCVGSAEAVASIVPALKPDVVLVDEAMHGSPGFAEMLNLVKAAFPSVKVEIAEGGREPDHCGPTGSGNSGTGVVPASDQDRSGASGLITVWSPKGGAGTTFLACNLAACVCGKGSHGVALIDLDLKWGDAAIHLGVNDGHTILDALPYLDDAAVGSLRRYMAVNSRSGVNALLAPGKPELSELVSINQVRRAVSLAKKEYEFVFLDTPQDVALETLMDLLEDSSAIVVVTTQDVACLRRVRISLQMMSRLRAGVERKTIVVVNQASDAAPATVSHIESFLNTRVWSTLPADRLVADSSVYEGVPLVVSDPGHRLSRAIVSVASRLCPGLELEKARGGRISLSDVKALIHRRVASGKPAGTAG